ncbi:hypothetical protein FOZ63_000183 [Perkinsus olseni]|uniref:Uroporphyrinogen decarboxylase n=1 Tax=Perkinsus olseni TaxID=32597 RepID=A0A7J6PHE1_PEROL|nr:hypothetical protein FOZ62_024567 [Perkinsus olseni]KAF4723575.1 hypothetical protein FOZ63_000183 [Perkinsus olseni]
MAPSSSSTVDYSAARKGFLDAGYTWPEPKQNRLLRAARGEEVDEIPVWIMRQAGRYLPEFKALRAEHDFVKVCQDPDLASEVTIQPYRRFNKLDACIVFSDILTIPMVMGQHLEMVPGTGPVLSPKLETPADIDKFLNLAPDVAEGLGYVYDAIFATVSKLQNELTVIGFCGAPWSLFCYMVEGGGSKTWSKARAWLYSYPEDAKRVMAAITDICIEYLVNQYDAGAKILQVFDTNGGEITPDCYLEFCLENFKRIPVEVKRQRPDALLIGFPKDVQDLTLFEDSAYDAISVTWRKRAEEARRELPGKVLQGNLDPAMLYSPAAVVKEAVEANVNAFGGGRSKYIANLGHGMMPDMTPEMAGNFIDAIKSVKL